MGSTILFWTCSNFSFVRIEPSKTHQHYGFESLGAETNKSACRFHAYKWSRHHISLICDAVLMFSLKSHDQKTRFVGSRSVCFFALHIWFILLLPPAAKIHNCLCFFTLFRPLAAKINVFCIFTMQKRKINCFFRLAPQRWDLFHRIGLDLSIFFR